MSKDNSSTSTSSIGEDTPPVGKVLTTSDDISIGTPKQPRKKRTEAQKLQTDTLAALDIDTNVLYSGSRILRSHKTLLDTEEQAIRKEVEHERLIDQEISLRPLRAGQTTQEKHLPTRQDFEYIYKHIDELDCQVWASDLELWLHFVNRHKLQTDPSVPVLDKDGLEYPDAIFSLETLLKLPTNKKYLKKKRKTHAPTHDTGTSSNVKDLADNNSSDSGTSSFFFKFFCCYTSPEPFEINNPRPILARLAT